MFRRGSNQASAATPLERTDSDLAARAQKGCSATDIRKDRVEACGLGPAVAAAGMGRETHQAFREACL